ncbi:MAG: hypothetical protein L0216_10020 [Planctomycetales bacterium]|nr:hypothetical protein [Planctomycetales bacterium]
MGVIVPSPVCRRVGGIAVLSIALSAKLAAPARGQEPPPEPAPAASSAPVAPAGSPLSDLLGWPAQGFLSLRYRARWNSDDSDQDAYALLGADLGDPVYDPVTVHLLARLSADLDGERDTEGHYAFDSLADTYSNPVNGKVYHAYLEAHRMAGVRTLRVGRQALRETPALATLDGILIATDDFLAPARLSAGLYGGLAARLTESSSEGDTLYGTFLEGRPLSGLRARLDWMHVSGGALPGTGREDLYAAAAWARPWPQLRLHARHTRLEGHARDLEADAALDLPLAGGAGGGWDLRVQASYRELFRVQVLAPLEYDLFVSTLGDLFPYREGRLLASQDLGRHLAVEAGYAIRRLVDEDDEGPFNREFARGHATGTVRDWPLRGLSASATVESWESQGRRLWTAGGEIAGECPLGFRIALGTDYALWRYDLYGDRERDHVRTWYARVRLDPAKRLRVSAEYRYEDDDYDIVHTATMGATWRF